METLAKSSQMTQWNIDLRPLACPSMIELRLKEPAENCYGHGAVLIWDQTENPFPQEFNQGQVSD